MCCNAIVYRAVKLVAENAASAAFLADEGAAERDRHPLLDLIARPNPRQDGAALSRGALLRICCSPATPMSRR